MRVGYHFNNQMMVGVIAGVSSIHGSNVSNDYYSYRIVEDNLGWSAGAYVRYDIPVIERIAIFADLSATVGSHYSRNITDRYVIYPSSTTQSRTTHTGDNAIIFGGVVLTPGVCYRFGSHLSADLYLDILHLAYSHIAVTPKDGTMTTHYNKVGMLFSNHPNSDSEYFMFGPTGISLSHMHVGVTYTF